MSAATMSNLDHCMALVRQHDRDRYLASLFIPQEKRAAVFALYAFSLEISRIRELVSEPAPGEIRLQWWREVLERKRQGEARANPVAAEILQALDAFHLPAAPLIDLIEARVFDLYDDPMPTLNDLEGYCGETCSTLIQLVTMVVADGTVSEKVADAAGHAGVAYAMTRLLRAISYYEGQGRSYIPRDLAAAHGIQQPVPLSAAPRETVARLLESMREIVRGHFGQARLALADLPLDQRTAFLPVSLVPLYLKAMERADYDPFLTRAEVSQIRRQWTLWRAAGRRGI